MVSKTKYLLNKADCFPPVDGSERSEKGTRFLLALNAGCANAEGQVDKARMRMTKKKETERKRQKKKKKKRLTRRDSA